MSNLKDLDPTIKRAAPEGANILDFEDDEPVLTQGPSREKNLHVNPLEKHFRIPGLSIKLPSQNYYYNNDEVELNLNGEIDVYPMTAGDELLLKNPDALLSGRAIELIIQSCVPQVSNVRSLLSVDIDSLLLAIRAVSYENEAHIDAVCPKCTTESTFTFDLSNILESQLILDPPYSVKLKSDLEVFIRPYNFAEQTKAVLTAFKQSNIANQLAQKADNPNITDEESDQIKEQVSLTMQKMVGVRFELMTCAITHIQAGSDTVEDKKFISEFLQNAPKKLVDKILKGLDELNSMSVASAKHSVMCSNEKCQHRWGVEVDFNPVNFFA